MLALAAVSVLAYPAMKYMVRDAQAVIERLSDAQRDVALHRSSPSGLYVMTGFAAWGIRARS